MPACQICLGIHVELCGLLCAGEAMEEGCSPDHGHGRCSSCKEGKLEEDACRGQDAS